MYLSDIVCGTSLYGFLSLVMLMMALQKFQYRSKLGSMSKDRPMKSVTGQVDLSLKSYHTYFQQIHRHEIPMSQFLLIWIMVTISKP